MDQQIVFEPIIEAIANVQDGLNCIAPEKLSFWVTADYSITAANRRQGKFRCLA
jgi:hypothetical protein